MGASRLPGPEKARHRELQGCPMAGADLMSYCVTYLRTRKARMAKTPAAEAACYSSSGTR